ncbi:SNF2 family DNA or RNA helicase [Paenibacillus cellulosilyticus]|uniref:SNF2 family DNA or RNA helicase n=1 Tax=Paenibacillus cellulosilyticus TaxID=375489 RepID=A0A2V2YTF1_9BACL|nr:DEAD/DEAH box helicase [Paenibacillus cellulosilyticus]PWW02734.1 SNF2 family DNA or RNA helicase [Paenibacillus cellulosilyticus]QKS45661.1 DEAD/DEAH box helicase [Paenibacillus cellulosilyticus]
MNAYADTLTIQANLTEQGDALIFGADASGYAPALLVKQRLFAWHEPSFYGTELEIEKLSEELELVVLPAEMVLPFFANPALLPVHMNWQLEGDAARIAALAPALEQSVAELKFVPSFEAYKAGKLQWTWDSEALDAKSRRSLRALADIGMEEPDGLNEEDRDAAFLAGLGAAFSAAVFHRHYGTKEASDDLRREFPLLFARDRAAAAAGLDERGWLVAAGWKADMLPFRPLLQLQEPENVEASSGWRLVLLMQDKLEPAKLAQVRLAVNGEASGTWPNGWTPHVHERSAAWLAHLRASLPADRLAGSPLDVLNAPLSDDEAWRFLTTDSQRLLSAGWQVLLPAWWEEASRTKPRLRAKVRSGEGEGERAGGSRSFFGLDALIEFDWRVSIGDTDLSEAEFRELVARGERLVQFRGQWVPLDPALLAQIRKAMAGVDPRRGLSFQDVLQLHLRRNRGGFMAANPGKNEESGGEQDDDNEGELEMDIELNAHLTSVMAQLTQQADWPSVPVPTKLQAELRSYQQGGFSWLAFLRRFGLGAVLADDMGLGKTIQFITYLLHVAEEADAHGERRPALLICPTSVLGNWQKEVRRFAPSLRILLHYGSKRLGGDAFYEEAAKADLVLTSYATSTLDQELLGAYTWSAICLDEAQNIKNAGTKQAIAVKSFPAQHRIALTGTPIENRLAELWSIYDFTNPGYLGTARTFAEQFGQAIERERDEKRTQELQRLVKPFMLRRKKKDPNIMLDLPEKNEMKTYIHLTGEQSALYEQTVKELMDEVKKTEGIKRKGAILSALTRLKQLCDHPVLFTKEVVPIPTDERDEAAESAMLIGRSAKLERLLDLVKELRQEGERCLIFTQYIGMGEMLQRVLGRELGEPVLYLHGGSSKTARDRMIEQFQSRELPDAEQPNVFILSIKAGGVGLNLTAANHVFHFDRWWNPAVENQATDRAYRMGQTRDVQVHKFISLGTLEERIDEMLESKQQLSDDVITSSENWITELSTDALRDLFTLRRDWSE